MRVLGSSELSIAEAVKTMKHLFVFVLGTQIVASSIGATVGSAILCRTYPGSIYTDHWRDWFVGDVRKNTYGRQALAVWMVILSY